MKGSALLIKVIPSSRGAIATWRSSFVVFLDCFPSASLWVAMTMLVVFLSACSFSRDGGFGHQFTLEPARIPSTAYRKTSHSLKVKLPSAAPELDTDRVALIQPDGRQDYIANAKWADFLPALVQSALVRSFASSGRYGNVVADDTPTQTRYVVDGIIEDFAIEMPRGGTPALAHIRLRLKLMPQGSTRVLKEVVLENTHPVPANDLSQMMQGLQDLFIRLQESAIAQLGPR